MTKPQCPKCGTELNEEFGMVTCMGCGSVLFIDFDGQAQLAAEEPSANLSETPARTYEARPGEYNENIGEQNLSDAFLGEANFGEPAYDNSPVETPVLDDAVIEVPMPQNETVEADDGPLDISAYANSEASQAKEGPLTYTLHIEGLDSKELRESLREALSESRFAWDPGALMATIREGKLHLKAVEPVKASVLVNRLKRLPLKIWWEQNVVTDSKP